MSDRKHRVLVVEDEALLMMVTVDMVEGLGYEVVEAPNAKAALTALEGDGAIDILLTDVNLPDIKGPELAARARVLRPGLPVVFATGYSMDVPTELRDGPAAVLNKPYWEEDLRRTLGSVVAAEAR